MAQLGACCENDHYLPYSTLRILRLKMQNVNVAVDSRSTQKQSSIIQVKEEH